MYMAFCVGVSGNKRLGHMCGVLCAIVTIPPNISYSVILTEGFTAPKLFTAQR